MPSQITNEISINLEQLIPPKPLPTRGRSFQLSSFAEWFIYPHGKSVYMYNLKNPKLCKEYREHAYPVGLAKFSPSGNLIASGDQCGNLKIWSREDLSTKLEIKILEGSINEISWSEDEKLIGVAGEGREKFAAVIKVEIGSSFGELIGPTKTCTSISLRSTHCVLGSDDQTLTIFRAAPTFKFLKTLKDHIGFVQVVRFNCKGDRFGSGGADGKVNIYSIDTGEMIVSGKWHDSSVLAMEWITDDILVTASADKTLKLWRIPDGTLIESVSAPPDSSFEKQISGLTLCSNGDGNEKDGKIIIVLRLDGSFELRDPMNLQLLDPSKQGFDKFVIGHSKNIVDLAYDQGNNLVTSVSYDGSLKTWSMTANNNIISTKDTINNFRNKSIQKLCFGSQSNDIRAICDNKLMNMDGSVCDFGAARIVGCSESGINFIISSDRTISLIDAKDLTKKNTKQLPIDEKSVHLAILDLSNKILAVSTDSQLNLISVSELIGLDFECKLIQSFTEGSAKITAMAFDSSSTQLAIADDQRRIKLYTLDNSTATVTNANTNTNTNTITTWIQQSTHWTDHSARIDSLLWLNASTLISAGVDGNLMAWQLSGNKYGPVAVIRCAHSAPINKLLKLQKGIFMSAASDSCLKTWTFCSE